MNRRFGKMALRVFVGLCIGVALAVYMKDEGASVSSLAPASGTAIGGSFSLIDQDGKPVTEKDYADSYKLVFFGFTNCPEICPTGLQKIAAVMEVLGDKAQKIQPLFITVDPARDTPDVMKDYAALFDPRIIGLTGTEEQIKAVEAAYKVYAAKVDDAAANDGYTMNHSAYIFFMSPQGELLALFSGDDSAQDMMDEIFKKLKR